MRSTSPPPLLLRPSTYTPAPYPHPLLISQPAASPQPTSSRCPVPTVPTGPVAQLPQLPLTTSLSSLSWVLSRSPALSCSPGSCRAGKVLFLPEKGPHGNRNVQRDKKTRQLQRQQARRSP